MKLHYMQLANILLHVQLEVNLKCYILFAIKSPPFCLFTQHSNQRTCDGEGDFLALAGGCRVLDAHQGALTSQTTADGHNGAVPLAIKRRTYHDDVHTHDTNIPTSQEYILYVLHMQTRQQ